MYSACALHGESGDEAHFSMVQVAPCWQPMVHPPVGQLRIVQVAPAAHWMMHGPDRQVSITHVEPAAQWSMKHAIWQVSKVHCEPGPHSSMLQPPPLHEPKRQTALVPLQVKTQPPSQRSMSQRLPSPQAPIRQPPSQAASRQLAWFPEHSRLQPPRQLGMVQCPPLQGIVQPPVSLQSTSQVAP